MKVNPVTLSFGNDTEREFLDNYHSSSVTYVRRVLILSLFIYSAFGILDSYLLPNYKMTFLIIRFCFGLPFIVLTFISTYFKIFIKYFQILLSVSLFLIVLAPLSITILAEPPINYSYYAGIIVVTVFAYTTIRLRFIYVSTVCWFVVILYNILAIYVNKTPVYILINNNFFLIASNIAGGIAAYSMEFFVRRDFYLLQLLKEEKEKVHVTNKELEKRIQKRTQELVEAKEKAEESDKLKSQFLSNMSHEFRTPLNGILGFAQLLKSEAFPIDKKDKYLDVIYNNGKHLLDIINNVIDVSKIEAKQIDVEETNFSINELLNGLVLVFKKKYPEKDNISFIVKNHEINDLGLIKADLNKLQQVLICLIDNAYKFTLEGSITVGYNLMENNRIKFFIKDTGIGIPKEFQGKIFKRFYQIENTDTRTYQGTGLGLAISKGLVEIMGGKIWLQSTLYKGSQFYFTIPLNT